MTADSNTPSDTEDRAGDRTSRGRNVGFWRRDFVGFALGVWASTAGSVVLGGTGTYSFRHWSGEPGMLVGILLVAPFVALVLTLAFKGWLAYRAGDALKTKRRVFLLPLAAGMACIPVCLAVISILPKSPMGLFEVVAMIVFLGMPVALAEAYFRLSLSKVDESDDTQR
jgi:hypothetical protein